LVPASLVETVTTPEAGAMTLKNIPFSTEKHVAEGSPEEVAVVLLPETQTPVKGKFTAVAHVLFPSDWEKLLLIKAVKRNKVTSKNFLMYLN
jgi:hypothetical protein